MEPPPWSPWLDEHSGAVAVAGTLYKVSGGLSKRLREGALDPQTIYDKVI